MLVVVKILGIIMVEAVAVVDILGIIMVEAVVDIIGIIMVEAVAVVDIIGIIMVEAVACRGPADPTRTVLTSPLSVMSMVFVSLLAEVMKTREPANPIWTVPAPALSAVNVGSVSPKDTKEGEEMWRILSSLESSRLLLARQLTSLKPPGSQRCRI